MSLLFCLIRGCVAALGRHHLLKSVQDAAPVLLHENGTDTRLRRAERVHFAMAEGVTFQPEIYQINAGRNADADIVIEEVVDGPTDPPAPPGNAPGA